MRRRTEPKPPPDGHTVRAELVRGRSTLAQAGIPSAWLDAEVLLAHVLGTNRVWLHGHPERTLTGGEHQRFHRLIARRGSWTPVAYLTGEREFYGHTLRVTPAVLIPRPETELLVDLTIEWLRHNAHARRVTELGTGSGAIAIAIAKAVPAVQIVATDNDPRALKVAAANVKTHRLSSRITLVRRDLLEGAAVSDVIVANLPYLSAARRRAWANELEYEPPRALDGGEDGLDLIRRAIAQAPGVLRPHGAMFLECDPAEPRRIMRLSRQQWPSATITIEKDLAGKDRGVGIFLP